VFLKLSYNLQTECLSNERFCQAAKQCPQTVFRVYMHTRIQWLKHVVWSFILTDLPSRFPSFLGFVTVRMSICSPEIKHDPKGDNKKNHGGLLVNLLT